MTVAPLGFAIDSSPLAVATTELDKLTSAASRTEQAATKVSGAGTRMSRGFADLNPALDKIIGSLGRLEGIAGSIDKRLDMMSSAATRAAKANSVLDQSAVEASTAYKQLEASLNAVTAAQKKADAAQASSLAMIDKQKASIAQLRAELAKLHNTPMPQQPNVPGPANNNMPNGGQGGVGNIAAQLFDIGATAGFMNPATVAIQQGPQLAQAFAGQKPKEALASLAGGLMAIASPLSLAAIGLTGVAAAAIQYGVGLVTASDDTKKLEEAMERHDGVMKKLEDRYGSLIDKAKGYSAESANVLRFESGSDTRVLTRETKAAGKQLFDEANIGFLDMMTNPRGLVALGAFQTAILKLQVQAREGKPDFDAFYDSLEKTASIDPKYAQRADELAKLVDQYRQGTKALEEMERVQRALFNDRGPTGALLSQGPTNRSDMGNLALWESQQRVIANRRRQGNEAQIAGINARSPQERAAAARAAAASQYNNDETGTERKARIEQAGVVALAQAERQLADAQRDRAASLDKIITDQQTEIDLIGKTGGAAVALRKEYELTSQLRMDAARQGIDVDQKELDLIKERTAALGQLTDQYNQSKFNFDMNQARSDARLSPKDLQVTTRLRQAGLPEDLNGSNAAQIRSQIQSQEQKSAIDQFSNNLATNLIQSGGDIGEAFGKTFLSALQETAQKSLSRVLSQMLNGIFDGSIGRASAGGALGSVAAAALGRSANDNRSGGYSGIANVIPVTRAPLGKIPDTDVASYIAKAATARGIDPSIALKVAQSEGGLKSWNMQSTYMKNGVQEPSFGPYQLYMGGGLGNAFQKQTGLDPRLAANGPAGVDFALDNAKKSGWGAWYGAAKVGVGKWDGIGTGGGETAADAVTKLADSAKAATSGLDTLGGGLGKLGSSLSSSFFPAAPAAGGGAGGGGMFSWLGGLFGGGGGGNLSKYAGLTGLFADGTNYAPGGMAIVGERGPELVNLPQGSRVFDTNKSAQMMGGANQSGQSMRPKLNVYVTGASGDNHVRELARQGAQEVLAQYDQSQTRGGILDNQQKANARKG